jgi:hypothetical protein
VECKKKKRKPWLIAITLWSNKSVLLNLKIVIFLGSGSSEFFPVTTKKFEENFSNLVEGKEMLFQVLFFFFGETKK